MTQADNNNAEASPPGSAPQMEKLIREHAECILFAEELMRIADKGVDDELAQGVAKVVAYNADELEPHLQHEEQTILRSLIQNHPEHAELCIKLGKEHGHIRTLVEKIELQTARKDLAEFGRVLKSHTLLEDKELFPLVNELFSPDQMEEIAHFEPFRRHASTASRQAELKPSASKEEAWLLEVERHLEQAGRTSGSIVLFPRFDPELNLRMAKHLGLEFFDYQKEVMDDLGTDAELISLEQLEAHLVERAQKSGIVSHNVEALLCVKSESERRRWLSGFLESDWPNPVLLPITVFQADVPEEHENVCDLEV